MARVLDGRSPAPADARGAAVALGVMDGVHVGHQAVLADARAKGGPLAAAVFEPHPRLHFQPSAAPFRLQTAAQRARALAALGVDAVFEIPFDKALADLSDADFAKTILHDAIGARHVSVGHDFRYGRGRTGDAATLAAQGAKLGFSVSVVAPVLADGLRISSTAIRARVADGDMRGAAALLSRPFAIEGEVIHGLKRGRTLGIPTANIALARYQRPRLGVYAARIDIDGRRYGAAVNVGVNPTVGELPIPQLEAHVLDFDGDLYGQTIEVALTDFLRDEAKFDSLEAMMRQIKIDMAEARALLA